MAALEEPGAAGKIGARAAQTATRAAHSDTTGFREIRNNDDERLPGPAAAGLAMRYSGSPALLARFRQIQKDTASAMNKASSAGKDLSPLARPLPAVMNTRQTSRDIAR